MIKKEPIKDEYGWVSVKNELPQIGHLVMVCTNNQMYYLVVRGTKEWDELYGSDNDGYGAIGITHWKELPKPPKVYEDFNNWLRNRNKELNK